MHNVEMSLTELDAAETALRGALDRAAEAIDRHDVDRCWALVEAHRLAADAAERLHALALATTLSALRGR